MKCPKCHYLSFEPEPRCRNCGYDLALADDDLAMRDFESPESLTAADDLPLRLEAEERLAGDPRGNVVDLPARPRAPRRPRTVTSDTRSSRTAVAAARVAALDEPVAEPADIISARSTGDDFFTEVARKMVPPAPAAAPDPSPETSPFLPEPPAPVEPPRPSLMSAAPPASSRIPTSELPLFVKGMEAAEVTDDALLDRAASPRAPLGVRRSVAEPPAAGEDRPLQSARPAGAFDRDLIDDLARMERDDARQARADARALVRAADIRANGDAASPVLRLAAAIVDLSLLSGISLAIVALTLRLCGLSLAEARVLPLVPLTAFLLLVSAGYLLLFTMAGGQTIGKMTFGLRTVSEAGDPEHRDPMSFQQAASRAFLTVPSVLALGLGFLPALFGDRRAVHDRLARTRVVRE